jgi:penicillin G amidase
VLRLVARAALIAVVLVIVVVGAFAVYVGLGWRADARFDGTLAHLPVQAAVMVMRDERGIPHIRADSIHDAMFAEGYVEGADRLFQMDLLRHHVYGRVAEWFGSAALAHDLHAREFDVHGVIENEYAGLSPDERAILVAFSEGVNAAIEREPLPVEYRLLVLRPQPWRPQDSLAVGFATVLDLIDTWDSVIERDRVFRRFGQAGLDALYPITDPRYDAPTTAAPPAAVAPLPALPFPVLPGTPTPAVENPKEGSGSNEWAVGGAHTRRGRALLANDPHLSVGIPGVWYLVDIEAPGLHVAGASLAGTPGVILGHNERVAWGATNGTVVSESVYAAQTPIGARRETFGVRFSANVERTYERDRHGFIVGRYSVDWEAARSAESGISTFLRLARAASIEEATAALQNYPGPTQNFVLADTSGRAAYQLAGHIPNDPFWGLRVHPTTDPTYRPIPFAQLPAVMPSRDARVFTANNRMYGRAYPLRLSPCFSAPYRAARIKALLNAGKRYGVGDFAAMQADTLSLPERELAADAVRAAFRQHAAHDPAIASLVAALARWDGRFNPDSPSATVAFALRRAALGRFDAGFFGKAEAQKYASSVNDQLVVLLRALRERPRGYVHPDDYDAFLVAALHDVGWRPRGSNDWPWSVAGPIPIRHPLAALGIGWFNGITLPGDGDAYAIHVQKASGAQSFRAVWDIGNWDEGGIVIPSGESGRPGSAHYKDLSATWVAQTLVPLPFSRAAVDAAARHRLELRP